MSRIDVEPAELQGLSQKFWSLSREIEDVRKALDRALSVPGWEGSSRWSVENQWRDQRIHLQDLADQAEAIASLLDNKAIAFIQADQEGENHLKACVQTTAGLSGTSTNSTARVLQLGKAASWLTIPTVVSTADKLKGIHEVVSVTRVVKSGKLVVKVGETHPNLLRVYGKVKYHGEAGLANGLRSINVVNLPGHIGKEAFRATAITTAVFSGVINSYENWHDYKDEGMTKVVTATALDTSLDVAITSVSAAGFATVGAGIGIFLGPPGVATGAAIGGKVGAVVGGFMGGSYSEQIKHTEGWETFVDDATEAVESTEDRIRETGERLGSISSAARRKIFKETEQLRKGLETGVAAVAALF
jgi:uncharacterized protein YukE/outer membrane lipoprotein SlyB